MSFVVDFFSSRHIQSGQAFIQKLVKSAITVALKIELSFSAGEVRSFVIYAIDWEAVQPRTRPYIYIEEEGANATLTWEYNNLTNALNWSLSGETGKIIALSMTINNFTGPNWGMNAIANVSALAHNIATTTPLLAKSQAFIKSFLSS